MASELDDEGSVNVRALAAAVDRLERRYAELAKALERGQPDINTSFGDALDDISAEVARLSEQLAREGDVTSGLSPVAWADVSAEQAPVILTELSEWIGTVLVQYDLDGGIVACWYRHPDVVQILVDLRLAWLTTYRNPEGGKVLGALDWHQRYLPAARQYLKGLKMKCSDREHTMRRTSFVVDPGALETYAVWWGSGHDLESEPDWVPPARPVR